MPTISFETTADEGLERVETTRDGIEFDDTLGAWRVRTETRELIIPEDAVEEIVSDTGEPLSDY